MKKLIILLCSILASIILIVSIFYISMFIQNKIDPLKEEIDKLVQEGYTYMDYNKVEKNFFKIDYKSLSFKKDRYNDSYNATFEISYIDVSEGNLKKNKMKIQSSAYSHWIKFEEKSNYNDFRPGVSGTYISMYNLKYPQSAFLISINRPDFFFLVSFEDIENNKYYTTINKSYNDFKNIIIEGM